MILKRIEPEGNLTSPLVLVGEAPGYDEEATGKPFIGRSGDLLFRQLFPSFGFSRASTYITNVVKERPSGNDISRFVKFGSGPNAKVKETPEFQAYVEELRAELAGTTANVLLAVGNVALYALCGLHGISKWRGSVLESTLLPGRKVIATFHPASALRDHTHRHIIAMDLARVRDELVSPHITRPQRTYILNPGFEEILSYIDRCRSAKRVAFDIEVTSHHVNCISLSPNSKEAISIPFATLSGESVWSPAQEAELWQIIGALLEDGEVRKLGQNVGFDSWFLYHEMGIAVHSFDDTMVAHKMCYPDFPAGLDFMCSVYTDEPYYKDDGKVWVRQTGTDEDFRLYNAKDSVVLHEVWDAIESDMIRLGLKPHYEEKLKTIPPLTFMTEHGMCLDREWLMEEKKVARKEATSLRNQIKKMMNEPHINLNSKQQVAEFFYYKLKIKPYKGRKQKEPTAAKKKREVELLMKKRGLDEKDAKKLAEARRGSVAEEALKRLAGTHGREEARLLLLYREHTKYISTYLNFKRDEDGRLRGSYNTVGTVSGRFSSSQTIFGTGLNVQTMPHRLKRAILADDGFLLVSIDLGQAENRVVAYTAPDLHMQHAFESGTDIHSLTAGMIFGKPIEAISDEDGSASIGGGKHSERFWGKKANHASNYGEGEYLFALQNEISVKESKRILSGYHRGYPGVKRWHARIDDEVWNKRWLVDSFGKGRTFKGELQRNKNKSAYSYGPQSTVREVMSRWGLCYVYYSEEFAEVIQLNDVHDSMELELPLSRGWLWIAERISLVRASLMQLLTGHGGTQFSIPADVQIGFNGGAWSEKNTQGMVKVDAEHKTVEELATLIEKIVREKLGATQAL